MTRYLFVPGGKRTEEDFDGVRALLEAAGHETDAITLSDPQKATLSDHIEELCDRIGSTGTQRLHLVGHSYASFVIVGAADHLPESVERLVFLDTLIPESGMSLLDFFAAAKIDAAGYGVPSWPPFVEKLVFDAAAFAGISKTYIHCLESQFLIMTQDAVRYVKAHQVREHWTYLEIQSDHYCMITAPGMVAEAVLHRER